MPRGLKFFLSSFLMGAMSLGIAYAGAVLTPAPKIRSAQKADRPATLTSVADLPSISAGETFQPGKGHVLAGAARASLEPRPDVWGGTWEKSAAKCETLPANENIGRGLQEGAQHVTDTRVKWAENPNCIYMGGYGLGPMFAVTSWDDPYGLWVRSVALSDGSKSYVLTTIDAAYILGKYRDMCERCGTFDLAEDLGAELGMPASSFMFSASHAHTAPDIIGGWGGVPDWYLDQVTDAIKATVRTAVANMRPAVLEAGEEMARQFNTDRRDFYRSIEDYGMTWFRVVEKGEPTADAPIDYFPGGTTTPPAPAAADADPSSETRQTSVATTRSSAIAAAPMAAQTPGCGNNGGGKKCPTPTPTAEPTPTTEPTTEPTPDPTPPTTDSLRAIATVGVFGAHPVTIDEGSGPADGDFPTVFARRAEETFGGVGLFVQGGLGNVSPRDGGHTVGNTTKERMGNGLVSLLPKLGAGRIIENPTVSTAQRFWNQPVTNGPLGSLGAGGFFDREFNQTPATVEAGKSNRKNCKSASPLSVRTAVSAVKIGPLWITSGPGELFGSYTNTIKEKNPKGITMVMAITNDGLGYLVPSIETDDVARQGVGFAGQVVEYEDAYSIDRCFSDMALEATLGLLGEGGVALSAP